MSNAAVTESSCSQPDILGGQAPLYELLFSAARIRPDQRALLGGADDPELSWSQLETESRRLAAALAENGIGAGDRVAFFMPKSSHLVTTIFATLMAGGAYVPIDPQQPAERAATILTSAEPAALVTTLSLLERLLAVDERWSSRLVLIVDAAEDLSEHHRSLSATVAKATPLRTAIDRVPADLAAILFTSGSTGTPKGVMISHGNLLNFISWAKQEMALGPDDVFANHAGFHFDLSTFDLFACTASAGTLWLIPEAHAYTPDTLVGGMVNHGVTVWYSVPSVLTLLMTSGALGADEAARIRYLLFAGEVFPIKHLRSLRDILPREIGLYNLYGPTETNVCTFYRVDSLDPARTTPVPIGQAINGAELTIVGEDGSPLAADASATGLIGELVVGGECVTPGYWRRDNDPSSENHRKGLHATGDLVSVEDGQLVYRGRKDRMVKVRGYRVELGEIESAVAAHPRIAEAAVITTTDEEATKIIAFYSSEPGSDGVSTLEMKGWCARRLPRYMIPNSIRRLEALPKTPNGKIDVRGLAGSLENVARA